MDNFLFRREWYDIISILPDADEQSLIYSFVVRSVFSDDPPSLPDNLSAACNIAIRFILLDINKSKQSYNLRKDMQEKGRQGALKRWGKSEHSGDVSAEDSGNDSAEDSGNDSAEDTGKDSGGYSLSKVKKSNVKKSSEKKGSEVDGVELVTTNTTKIFLDNFRTLWQSYKCFANLKPDTYSWNLSVTQDIQALRIVLDYCSRRPSLNGQNGRKMDLSWFWANFSDLQSEARIALEKSAISYNDFYTKHGRTPQAGDNVASFYLPADPTSIYFAPLGVIKDLGLEPIKTYY